MTYNYNWLEDSPAEMIDPTETYEAWKYREAEMQMEEQKREEFYEKVKQYMQQYEFVNKEEIYAAAQNAYAYALGEDPFEYQLSYGECSVAWEYAKRFIEEDEFVFDEDGNVVKYKPYESTIEVVDMVDLPF